MSYITQPETFEGGGLVTPNLRTVRAQRNAINAAKTGITALGSDTTGVAPGAAGNFSSILGGDRCSAQGDYAIAAGHGSEAQGADSIALGFESLSEIGIGIAIGSQCVVYAPSAAGVAIGEACHVGNAPGTANAANAVCMGWNNNNLAVGACIPGGVGNNISAAADYAFCCGVTNNATVPGEFSHSSGALSGLVQGNHEYDLGIAGIAAPGTLKTRAGTEADLANFNFYTVQMEVRFIGNTTLHAKRADEVHIYTLNFANPGIVIVSDTATYLPVGFDFAAQGWTIVASNPVGSVLRFTVSPGASGDTINVSARVRFLGLGT